MTQAEIEFKKFIDAHVVKMQQDHKVFMRKMRNDFLFKILPMLILLAIIHTNWFEQRMMEWLK